MPAVPPELGPYRVVRPLGRGGMGTVLLAEDSRLGRLVALKAFAGPEAQSDYARQQLLREARAAATLSHPHIAGVHDVLDIDGQVVIVFEYVDGETLSKRIVQGPMVVATALQIAAQLAEGLAAAHARGIIHRDLKPSNIVITRDGTAKILDFGIARIVPVDESAPTQARTTTSFVGTIGYASPEQCLGQPVDARSDVFSLAVVTFEMLTGKRPFAGQDATTVLRAMLQGDPPRVSATVPGISKPLDALIRSALAHDPAQRPIDARAFNERLRAVREGRASTPMLSSNGRRWAIAALLALALGTGALIAALVSGPTTVVEARAPVVAVMPLTNASGDASKDFMALGVAENLITRLAALPSVTVLSRSTVVEARGRNSELAALAKTLDATYFVEGSVQQAGASLSINLNLLRPDGSVVWADVVQGAFENIFDLQSRLAASLSAALQVQLSAADRAMLARQPTMNADALAAYWRGRTLFERKDVKGNLLVALESFDHAIALDPKYASAHAARGEALWAQYLESRRPDHARAAIDAGKAASNLDPNSAEARLALAVTLAGTGQPEAALNELHRALALRPNFEDARIQLGRVLSRQRRTDEALAEFQRVTAIRPNNAAAYSAMGASLFEAGRYAEAASAFEQVIRLQPDNAVAHQQAGVAYQSVEDNDRALVLYQKALSIRPYPQAYSNIGAIYHSRGEFEKAVDAYKMAISLRPNARETHRNLGDAYSMLRRPADARSSYHRAIELALTDLRVNSQDARAMAALAVYLQKAGREGEAGERLAEAIRYGADDFEVFHRAAQVHALAGRGEQALDALEAAVTRGFNPRTAASEDEMRSVRQSARFVALLQSSR
ncbi:MAG TPA: tetratricopeptide repeat protein [Vicinamibacterales bacterium]|nr:tetratricopeptide repeat protein [Vicinamibacterales bacterium]